MPELPEVQTTVAGLQGVVRGKTIKSVWSDFHLSTAHSNRQTIKNKRYFENFKKKIIGSKIVGVERRGKNILIHTSPQSKLKKSPEGSTGEAYTIVVHMKMTGCLMYKKDYSDEKYIHLIFTLSNNHYLLLSDLRKFASVTISETENLHLHESIKSLGPEPLDPDFKKERFLEIIKSRKNLPIKSALLDQSGVVGIGNIYSDEILFETGIHPLSKPANIPDKKLKEMYDFMKKILKFSISKGGDSKSDYRNAFGGKGEFQNFHKAYGNKGKKCPKRDCLGIIERIVVKGRSSHYCPAHQKQY